MSETKVGGGGEWTALREALLKLRDKAQRGLDAHRGIAPEWAGAVKAYTLALKELAALAAAAPAPHQLSNDDYNKLVGDAMRWRKLQMDAPPPQDGQGAERLGPPRGGSSSDLAGPSNLKVGDEVWVRAKVMQFIEPEHNGVEILLEIGRNELMRTWCNASDLSKAEREVASATAINLRVREVICQLPTKCFNCESQEGLHLVSLCDDCLKELGETR